LKLRTFIIGAAREAFKKIASLNSGKVSKKKIKDRGFSLSGGGSESQFQK